METPRIKKYSYFIGTDVSKDKLDHAVVHDGAVLFHKVTVNTPNGVIALVDDLLELPGFRMSKAVFCMEHTGIYCNYMLTTLHRHRANVVIETPSKIRNSLGTVRSKNDKIDSIRIAFYAYQNKEKLQLWIPKRPIVQQLANLIALRHRLVGTQTALKVPIKEQRTFLKDVDFKPMLALCTNSTEAIANDIAIIEQTIKTKIEDDPTLSRLMELITSVPGVGLLIGLNILIYTNEFKDINEPKKFACYAGVAPFIVESGKYKGKAKVSFFANKRMKALLHLSAMTAKRVVPEIKDYFERRTMIDGKHKMSVINAIRYKIILRVFACVNQNRIYEKDYKRMLT
jgi:transposase